MSPAARRVAVAALPFALVAGLFAAALARHLAGPDRQRDPAGYFAWAFVHEDVPLPPAGGLDFVTLERAPCAAGCAAYAVRVLGSGRVEFTGLDAVCQLGPAVAYVRRERALRLVEAARAVLPPGPADASAGVAVRVHAGGRDAGLAGAAGEGGTLVAAVAHAVDELAGDAHWLPDAGRCPGGGAPLRRAAASAP